MASLNGARVTWDGILLVVCAVDEDPLESHSLILPSLLELTRQFLEPYTFRSPVMMLECSEKDLSL